MTGSERLRMTGSEGLRMTGSEGLRMTGSERLRMTGSEGLRMTGSEGLLQNDINEGLRMMRGKRTKCQNNFLNLVNLIFDVVQDLGFSMSNFSEMGRAKAPQLHYVT